jgi:diguanylate cyclase (GGDEF)-like protein/PAS domain S-box-containing protein
MVGISTLWLILCSMAVAVIGLLAAGLSHRVKAAKKLRRELATLQHEASDLTQANRLLRDQIAERKEAEQALRRGAERFQVLTELSSDWSWEQDTSFRFVDVSEKVPSHGGISSAQHLGRTRWELPRTEPVNTTWDQHRAMLRAHQPFRDLLLKRIGTGGEAHYVTVSGQPIFDADGVFSGYRGVASDITERITAELGAREKEEYFRATFEQAAVGIAHTTTGGRFLMANRRLQAMLGYPNEELLALTTREVTHPDDRDQQDTLRLELITGQRSSFAVEKRYVTKAGAVLWVNRTVTTARRPLTEEAYLIQVIEDISERKRTQARLEHLTRARRVMAECRYALIHATDESAMLQSMCSMVVDSGGYKLAWVGMATGDPVRPLHAAAHAGFGGDAPMTGSPAWGSEGRYRGFMAGVIATGKPYLARDILNHSEYAGRQHRAVQHGFHSSLGLPLRGEGGILGALGIYAREPDAFDDEELALLTELAGDIAYGIDNLRVRVARQQAEKAARDTERYAEARYRATFDSAPVGIMHHSLDRVILRANTKLCEILGYTEQELVQMPIAAIIHPDYRDTDRKVYTQPMMEGKVGSFASERRYLRKDGSSIWVNRTISLIRDAAGTPQYYVRIIEDITERKRAEGALQTSEEMLRATFDQAGVGIAISATDLRYLQINDKYCEMLAYSREELLAMSLSDVIDRGDVEHIVTGRRRMLAGEQGPASSERRLTRKDGSTIWVSHSTTLVRGENDAPKHFLTMAEDITARKRAEAALHNSEEQFGQLAGNIPQVFWITDANHKDTIYVSPAAETLIGRPLDEIRARPRLLVRAVHPEDRLRVHAARRSAADGRYDEIYRIVRPDSSVRWVHERAFPVRDTAGRVYRIAGIAEDVTERKLAEERLKHLAHYDVLTGLPNRALFYDRLKHTLAQAKRHAWTIAVMFIDVDRFKNINDTLGHAIGDVLLQQISKRLIAAVRGDDTVGRLGGDEFAIVLSNLGSSTNANLVAQKLMASFSEPFRMESGELYVTASIGVTLYPGDGADQDALIKNADIAMYRAKQEGRNTFEFYAPEMNARAAERLDMEVLLRRALARDEFVLYYQPKVAVESGRIIGVEALIRWNSKELGMVSPMQFIPLAEETGLIMGIGEWVVKTACAQNKAWRDQELPPVLMSVNLSPRQFQQKNLVGMISGALAAAGIAPDTLELEITEGIIMHDAEKSSAVLRHLSDLGVQLSIDDFGTGYSSLAYLKRFPVQRLKIDQSFVRDLTTDPDDAGIVTAVIAMAKSLKLTVVAEGVETSEQLAFLSRLRCDEYQGYYFSRPVPAEELEHLLRKAAVRPVSIPVAAAVGQIPGLRGSRKPGR